VVVLVASLVLTTKASDDPTYDGQAAVHGHPKMAVGSGRQKPIAKILMSSKTDSEELTMPPVITEDNAMIQNEELTNVPESNESMIEEMSEHDKVISVHEFKEVLHELVKDAVDKIVTKKVGIVGKLKTAKQNLIGHDGEVTGRDPQQFSCTCNPTAFDSRGRGNCNHLTLDFNGREWCYLEHHSRNCFDAEPSVQLRGFFWSHVACRVRVQPRNCRRVNGGVKCD